MEGIKGFKVFNSDWTCRGFQYAVGKTYEEEANPTYTTTGGYLKVLDESECGQLWWDALSESNKEIIEALPNFDSIRFEMCTGIKVGD